MRLHTPGPWATEAQGDANHYFTRQPNGHWLASIQFNGELSIAEQEANARLIDAAPDLLEALKVLLPVAANAYGALSKDLDQARAAIAKASVPSLAHQ